MGKPLNHQGFFAILHQRCQKLHAVYLHGTDTPGSCNRLHKNRKALLSAFICLPKLLQTIIRGKYRNSGILQMVIKLHLVAAKINTVHLRNNGNDPVFQKECFLLCDQMKLILLQRQNRMDLFLFADGKNFIKIAGLTHSRHEIISIRFIQRRCKAAAICPHNFIKSAFLEKAHQHISGSTA